MDVDRVLEESKKQQEKLLARVNVEAPDADVDEGNLLFDSPRPLDMSLFKQNPAEFLKEAARDGVQMLLNALWKLPSHRDEDGVFAELPPGKTPLPREKHVPKPKPLTRWEKFAQEKGILKRKKSRMVWDEKKQDWLPAWGYKRANEESDLPYLEVPDNADPYEDQFEKLKLAKKERVAKNEARRQRNLAEAGSNEAAAGDRKVLKAKLNAALRVTKESTASMGKFDKPLDDEPKARAKGIKRKREPVVGDLSAEKQRLLSLADKIVHQPLTVETSTGTALADEEAPDAASALPKVKRQGKKRRSKAGASVGKSKFPGSGKGKDKGKDFGKGKGKGKGKGRKG